MASHAFITTMLMAPGGNSTLGVDWKRGTNVWEKTGAPFGSLDDCEKGDLKITSCDKNGISWEWGTGVENEKALGKGANPDCDGPDVFVWFKNKNGDKLGGFLDRWTLDRAKKRDFGNIRGGWKMDPGAILSQASHAKIGLKGVNGRATSNWRDVKNGKI